MPEPTLEIVWTEEAEAELLLRDPDGETTTADVAELLELALDPPANAGGSARVVFAVLELAQRSVTEGLVHPYLDGEGSDWNAFWGATLDESVQAQLTALAAALPEAAARHFGGDRDAVVHDLYPVAVDRIARDRLRAAKVDLRPGLRAGRPSAVERFLGGLTAPDPELPPSSGYAALQRRLSRWVEEGLGSRSSARWTLGIHLDERGERLVAELWLHAEDDPTLALPASLLEGGGDEIFTFLRATDARRDLARRLHEVEELLAGHGLRFDAAAPTEAELDPDEVNLFLREGMPALEERGVPVLLPSQWLGAPSRLRVDLKASSGAFNRASGFLSRDALARFDWQVALGDVTLSEDQLRELALAKEPLLRAGGRWHALRRSDVEKAIRFLERRRREGGIVDLVRAVAGVEAAEAGLELGDVALDEPLAGLLGEGDARYAPRPTPAGMQYELFAFQERGHGWLRLLSDLGVGGILADDMGLGKTVQAIAMLVSEREEATEPLGPTLVVCPMSVVKQWGAEIARFAPGLRVHVHHGPERLGDAELARAASTHDVVVTSYDLAARDAEALAAIDWDRLLLDEAQDVKNPATKRARALRLLRARRRIALTGTPIENRLGELWAIMDILNPGLLGSRESFDRTFARPIELANDEGALERLRALTGPFVLRREKDDPEVELELPPITVEKDWCTLTVEQASLYRATVDRWLPRIESHEDRFGRRGAVLAMLGHLKQVCNHPEMLVATGAPLDGRSGKLERLVELLADVPEGDKSLVFTQYPGFDRLVPHLAERLGVEVGFFHGRLNAGQRTQLLDRFARPEGPRVLVVSIRAGGRGLNLPAANHVFHFDRWWNPAVEQQATDRAHRFGQRKHVYVHSLICRGTLEERIDALLDSKRELAEKVIAGRSDDWLGDLDLGAIRAAVALAPELEEVAV